MANPYALVPSNDADFWLGVAWRVVGVLFLLTVAVRLAVRWTTSTPSRPSRRVRYAVGPEPRLDEPRGFASGA
ncbi:hypothetical protein ACPPVW_03025 [Leifsonia sp. McL0607]|uniref:hypothetical protein n=1 Tax=Leifsonia sp. McL0607 TaxID=3415672 RepID=UPI003CEE8DB6